MKKKGIKLILGLYHPYLYFNYNPIVLSKKGNNC